MKEGRARQAAGKMDGRRKPRPGLTAQRKLVAQAAVELFVQQGSAAVSVAAICTAADVSRPTFYRCFADKDALVAHLYQEAVDDSVLQLLKDLQAGKLGAENGQAAVFSLVDAIFDRGPYVSFVFAEAQNPSSPAAKIIDQAYAQWTQVFERWATNVGATPPSPLLLRSMFAGHQWLVQNAIRQGASPKLRAETKEACWQLVQSSLAAIGLTKRSSKRRGK